MKKVKLFISSFALLSLSSHLAQAADVFLEPYVGMGQLVVERFDQTHQDYDLKDIANGFMAGAKAGLKLNQRLFTGIDYQTAGPFTFGRMSNKAEMTITMFGIGLGLDYSIPRFWAGYYFNHTIRDAAHSINFSGDAYKLGFGLTVTRNLHANIEVIFHNISSSSPDMGTSNRIRAQSAFASVSVPLDLR